MGLCRPNTGSIRPPEEQRERKSSQAAAIALRWDDSRVSVLCPFCHRTHNHSILHFDYDDLGHFKLDERGQYTYNGPSPTRSESRRAHCNYDVNICVEYTILFPFEDDPRVKNLSFEIEQSTEKSGNEHTECFRTVGLGHMDLLKTPECDDENLRATFQNLDISEIDFEVSETVLGETITHRASDLLKSHAVTGCLQEMRVLLDAKPTAGDFTKIRDKNGCSLLALAVPNGNIDVVRYLVELGADVDSHDAKGRTPLMEAALWSHIEIVSLLLKKGANKTLRDSNGMVAVDFANESDRNDEERHTRAFKYSEDPFVKKGHRRLIKALLGWQSALTNHAEVISIESLDDAHFYKSSNIDTISFVIPKKGIKITTQSKTAAFLLRHHAFPTVAAISGWTSPGSGEFAAPEAGYEKLDSAHWMPAGLAIAKYIGFEFEEHGYDRQKQKPPGSYYACHAEAQLMSFFVSRNYLFRDYYECEKVMDDFLQLFLLQERNRRAHIIVSAVPCPSCQRFARHIEQTLGIRFDFVPLEVMRRQRSLT